MLTILAELAAGLVWLLRSTPHFLCAAIAWTVLLLGSWQLVSATRETVQRSRAMHQIPCANCQFFTNDHRLKCPVHPQEALTPEAVNCLDFEG